MPDGPKNVAKNTKGALKNNIHIQILLVFASSLKKNTQVNLYLTMVNISKENLDLNFQVLNYFLKILKLDIINNNYYNFYKEYSEFIIINVGFL